MLNYQHLGEIEEIGSVHNFPELLGVFEEEHVG